MTTPSVNVLSIDQSLAVLWLHPQLTF